PAGRRWVGAGKRPKTGYSLEPRAWLFHPVFAKVNAKVLWHMFDGPRAAIHEIWFGPRLTVDGAGRHHRDRHGALRRISRARIHDVCVNAPRCPEKLLVAARSRERHILQENLGSDL